MDLTKITTPFGLLDEATQVALRNGDHDIEVFGRNAEWVSTYDPTWENQFTYRARSRPLVCWISKTDPSTVIYQPPVYDPSNWRMFREVMDGDAQ